MRPKSLILIIIALACGLVASIGISQILEKRSTEKVAVETVRILIAQGEIKVGEVIDSRSIALEKWPKNKVPSGTLTSLDEVKGRRTRQQIFEGEPILEGKLISEDELDQEASERIRSGYRAVTVKVQEDVAVGNLLKPGDTVDVLVFLKKNDSIPGTMMKTILQNVRVFAVNDRMDRLTDKMGKNIKAKTVTLEVKPSQVELISLADSIGRIRLSCRRSDDMTIENTTGASPTDVYGLNRSGLAETATGSFPWLNKISPPPSESLSAVSANTRRFPRMEILEPNGIRYFDFPDDGSPPREVTNEVYGPGFRRKDLQKSTRHEQSLPIDIDRSATQLDGSRTNKNMNDELPASFNDKSVRTEQTKVNTD